MCKIDIITLMENGRFRILQMNALILESITANFTMLFVGHWPETAIKGFCRPCDSSSTFAQDPSTWLIS